MSTIPKPKIELKNFQFAEFASEETNCYTAVVWVNGIPSFTARNDGHGGPDRYDPIDWQNKTSVALYKSTMAVLEAYCKSLPQEEAFGSKFDVTVEGYIGELVDAKVKQMAIDKAVQKSRKALKDRIMILMPDGTVSQSKKLQPQQVTPENMQKCLVNWKGKEIVNTMPIERQNEIFTKMIQFV